MYNIVLSAPGKQLMFVLHASGPDNVGLRGNIQELGCWEYVPLQQSTLHISKIGKYIKTFASFYRIY